MASERARRADVERSGRHLVDTDLRPGSYVETVEQSLEATAAKVDICEACNERLGTAEWV
jgi:hypothetical protein